jgi:hypothetical protein
LRKRKPVAPFPEGLQQFTNPGRLLTGPTNQPLGTCKSRLTRLNPQQQCAVEGPTLFGTLRVDPTGTVRAEG